MSNKENGNQNAETQVQQENPATTVENQTPVQQNVAPQPAPQVTAQPAEQPKKGVGGWLKEHWKGVTVTVIGVGTAVASVVKAYTMGKQAGVNTCYQQMQSQSNDDSEYGLNPNVEE